MAKRKTAQKNCITNCKINHETASDYQIHTNTLAPSADFGIRVILGVVCKSMLEAVFMIFIILKRPQLKPCGFFLF